MDIKSLITAIKIGGDAMLPLILIAIIVIIVIIDKILFYRFNCNHRPAIYQFIENFNFDWQEFASMAKRSNSNNIYIQFILRLVNGNQYIIDSGNKIDDKSLLYLEELAIDEAKKIEKKLCANIWILETSITIAPLIGLFGTIIGMMGSFKIIANSNQIVNPTGITAGVAEALIATAGGLLIAIISLCFYNLFQNIQNNKINELERMGSKIINYLKNHK